MVVVYCNLPQHQCLVVRSLRINGFLGDEEDAHEETQASRPFWLICVSQDCARGPSVQSKH